MLYMLTFAGMGAACWAAAMPSWMDCSRMAREPGRGYVPIWLVAVLLLAVLVLYALVLADCRWHGMESIRSRLFFVQYSNNPVKKL